MPSAAPHDAAVSVTPARRSDAAHSCRAPSAQLLAPKVHTPAGDRGTVLMLMPAAVLIIIVLGAFAVDATLVFLGEREVSNLASGLANDIAAAALDDPAFYRQGTLRLNPTHAHRITNLSLTTYTPQYLETIRVDSLTINEAQATITLSATVPYLFSSALPAAPTETTVSATSTATARQE